jgi:hypothetical protein
MQPTKARLFKNSPEFIPEVDFCREILMVRHLVN